MQKEIGIKAENHVIAELNQLGIPHEYIDDYYDIEAQGIKIEIKSASLSVNNGKTRKPHGQYRTGRFDFTSKENRQLQRKNNVWICFVLRYKTKYMTLGYYPSKKIRSGRYIALTKIARYKLQTIQEVIHEETQNDKPEMQ